MQTMRVGDSATWVGRIGDQASKCKRTRRVEASARLGSDVGYQASSGSGPGESGGARLGSDVGNQAS